MIYFPRRISNWLSDVFDTDDCSRCAGKGSVSGYRHDMLNTVPCPACRPDAYQADNGRVANG